jgi:transposase InsO family protein
MGQPRKADEMPLQPQIVLEPFEKWAIDFVGPFNPPSHQKAYILVCTDYVTKWVEARAVTRAIEQVVANFLFEEIFARYGTPREIVSDGGSQFTSHMIGKLMQKYGVKHRVKTPYHPQANEQVEITNKVLENILTKTVASHRRDWAQKLLEALWAYRTTWRNTTGFSPFELVYGKVPLFPVEFEISTLRTTLEVGLDPSEAHKHRLE